MNHHRSYLAVGSNLGDRFQNIASAIELLCDPDFESPPARLVSTSLLHETAPMYLEDQPAFLNGVLEIETELQPLELLRRIKRVEKRIGRNLTGIRNGPRPVDLDILFFQTNGTTSVTLDTDELVVPHPRIAEREFVLKPLCEVAGEGMQHPTLGTTVGQLYHDLEKPSEPAVCVMPLPRGRMLSFHETIVMGILNVTPDSFSDGGEIHGAVDKAVQRALDMERDGAGILDIGGESTRPGAKEVAIEEELQRTIPVIQEIRKVSDIPISIDTRHSAVARAAVAAGADIVNDVSGGTFDPDMLRTVAELKVPIVLMHMRGTPETMLQMTDYDDVVSEVAVALMERSRAAEKAGIPRWLQILDPGIGFAKDLRGNLLLLKHFDKVRSLVGNAPLLLGTSRKGFLGKISGEENPQERDFATAASCVTALATATTRDGASTGAYNIIRAHNVKGLKQALMIMDAILKVD